MQHLINCVGKWSEVELQLRHLTVPPSPPPLAYHTAVACELPEYQPFPFWPWLHSGTGEGTRGLTRIMSMICIPKREKTTASPSSLMCRCSFLHFKQNAAGFVGGSRVDTGPRRQPNGNISGILFLRKKGKEEEGCWEFCRHRNWNINFWCTFPSIL